MPSSTFNFRTLQVPLLQIAISVALVVAYHCFIIGFKVKPGAEDTPAKHNIKIIENYELKRKPALAIGLGSSIFNRVMVEIGPAAPDFENLCLVGYSAIDGAAVIRKRKRYPRLAVVELSLMLAKKDKLNIETEVPTYKIWIAPYTPIVRSEFQPSAILHRKLEEIYGSRKKHKTASSRDEIKFGFRRTVSSSTDLPSNLALLRKSVRHLEKHGTTVCFVFVPHSPTILSENTARKQMEPFQQSVPESKYRWIKWSGAPRKWNAPDGWHLTREEAKLFGQDMLKQLTPIWKSVNHNKIN